MGTELFFRPPRKGETKEEYNRLAVEWYAEWQLRQAKRLATVCVCALMLFVACAIVVVAR